MTKTLPAVPDQEQDTDSTALQQLHEQISRSIADIIDFFRNKNAGKEDAATHDVRALSF